MSRDVAVYAMAGAALKLLAYRHHAMPSPALGAGCVFAPSILTWRTAPPGVQAAIDAKVSQADLTATLALYETKAELAATLANYELKN